MTSNGAVDIRPHTPAPARISQATAVEQSRAIAEVQAMVIVAQQCPRSVPAAIAAMEEACQQIELAEKAFYRFPRGSETVSGESVYLARELARCWGNIQHGVTELRREDGHGQSEMLAFAWDLQVNTRSSSTFIVPHKRDTRGGVKDLTDMRDIYENNANNGARRLREAIFAVLPAWFVARASAICTRTLESGGGKPLAERIADAVKAFERYGVTPARMQAKFGGRPMAEWTGHDVALLGTIYESIRQGTVTADDEFPAARVTAEEITGQPEEQPKRQRAQRQRRPHVDDGTHGINLPPGQQAHDGPVTLAQQIVMHFKRLGIEDREERLIITGRLADVDAMLTSTNELSGEQQRLVLGHLETFRDIGQLYALTHDGDKPDGGQAAFDD